MATGLELIASKNLMPIRSMVSCPIWLFKPATSPASRAMPTTAMMSSTPMMAPRLPDKAAMAPRARICWLAMAARFVNAMISALMSAFRPNASPTSAASLELTFEPVPAIVDASLPLMTCATALLPTNSPSFFTPRSAPSCTASAPMPSGDSMPAMAPSMNSPTDASDISGLGAVHVSFRHTLLPPRALMHSAEDLHDAPTTAFVIWHMCPVYSEPTHVLFSVCSAVHGVQVHAPSGPHVPLMVPPYPQSASVRHRRVASGTRH